MILFIGLVTKFTDLYDEISGANIVRILFVVVLTLILSYIVYPMFDQIWKKIFGEVEVDKEKASQNKMDMLLRRKYDTVSIIKKLQKHPLVKDVDLHINTEDLKGATQLPESFNEIADWNRRLIYLLVMIDFVEDYLVLVDADISNLRELSLKSKMIKEIIDEEGIFPLPNELFSDMFEMYRDEALLAYMYLVKYETHATNILRGISDYLTFKSEYFYSTDLFTENLFVLCGVLHLLSSDARMRLCGIEMLYEGPHNKTLKIIERWAKEETDPKNINVINSIFGWHPYYLINAPFDT